MGIYKFKLYFQKKNICLKNERGINNYELKSRVMVSCSEEIWYLYSLFYILTKTITQTHLRVVLQL